MAFVFNKLNNLTNNQPRVQDMLAGGQAPQAPQSGQPAQQGVSASTSTGISGGQISPEQAGKTKFTSPTELLKQGAGLGAEQVSKAFGEKADAITSSLKDSAETYSAASQASTNSLGRIKEFAETGEGDGVDIKNDLSAKTTAIPDFNYDPSEIDKAGTREGRSAVMRQGRGPGYTQGMFALDSALLGRTELDPTTSAKLNSLPGVAEEHRKQAGEISAAEVKAREDANKYVKDTVVDMDAGATDAKTDFNTKQEQVNIDTVAALNKSTNDARNFVTGLVKGAKLPPDVAARILSGQATDQDEADLWRAIKVPNTGSAVGATSGSFGLTGPDYDMKWDNPNGLINTIMSGEETPLTFETPNVTDADFIADPVKYNRLMTLTGGKPLVASGNKPKLSVNNRPSVAGNALIGLKNYLSKIPPQQRAAFINELLSPSTRDTFFS